MFAEDTIEFAEVLAKKVGHIQLQSIQISTVIDKCSMILVLVQIDIGSSKG